MRQPTDAEIHELAKQMYQDDRNEHMPPWSEVPYSYAIGYLNDAAIRLGWKPTAKLKSVNSEEAE